MKPKQPVEIKAYVYIALMAVIICVCSWIAIPFVVPFTMQTFAVFCSLLLLGGKKGTAAIGKLLVSVLYITSVDLNAHANLTMMISK